MTQNSVLSQNWVKCTVCTHMAQATCTLLTGSAVSWLLWPYRGSPGAVSWPCCRRAKAVSQGLPGLVARSVSRRVVAHPRALLRAMSQPPQPCREPPGHIAVPYRTPIWSCRSTYTVVSWPVSLHTQQPGYAHALPTVSQGLSVVSWLYRGRGWPCRGPCSYAQLPCVMIQSIVS